MYIIHTEKQRFNSSFFLFLRLIASFQSATVCVLP